MTQPTLFDAAPVSTLTCAFGSPWGRYGCGDEHGPCAACLAFVEMPEPPKARSLRRARRVIG